MKDGVFFFQAEGTTATTTPVGWDTFVFRPTYVEVYSLPFKPLSFSSQMYADRVVG